MKLSPTSFPIRLSFAAYFVVVVLVLLAYSHISALKFQSLVGASLDPPCVCYNNSAQPNEIRSAAIQEVSQALLIHQLCLIVFGLVFIVTLWLFLIMHTKKTWMGNLCQNCSRKQVGHADAPPPSTRKKRLRTEREIELYFRVVNHFMTNSESPTTISWIEHGSSLFVVLNMLLCCHSMGLNRSDSGILVQKLCVSIVNHFDLPMGYDRSNLVQYRVEQLNRLDVFLHRQSPESLDIAEDACFASPIRILYYFSSGELEKILEYLGIQWVSNEQDRKRLSECSLCLILEFAYCIYRGVPKNSRSKVDKSIAAILHSSSGPGVFRRGGESHGRGSCGVNGSEERRAESKHRSSKSRFGGMEGLMGF